MRPPISGRWRLISLVIAAGLSTAATSYFFGGQQPQQQGKFENPPPTK